MLCSNIGYSLIGDGLTVSGLSGHSSIINSGALEDSSILIDLFLVLVVLALLYGGTAVL
jgi:hypothetical protein